MPNLHQGDPFPAEPAFPGPDRLTKPGANPTRICSTRASICPRRWVGFRASQWNKRGKKNWRCRHIQLNDRLSKKKKRMVDRIFPSHLFGLVHTSSCDAATIHKPTL